MGSKIKCSHALVKKLSEAQEILDLVNKGEKFGALCKKRSIDSGSAKRDGNLGYFGARKRFCNRRTKTMAAKSMVLAYDFCKKNSVLIAVSAGIAKLAANAAGAVIMPSCMNAEPRTMLGVPTTATKSVSMY